MKKTLRILMLEDNADDAWLIEQYLKRSGIQFKLKDTTGKVDFVEAIRNDIFDLILCDGGLPYFDSGEALTTARAAYPRIPFIVVSGHISQKKADELLNNGADDFVSKDHLKHLALVIQRVIKEKREKEKV